MGPTRNAENAPETRIGNAHVGIVKLGLEKIQNDAAERRDRRRRLEAGEPKKLIAVQARKLKKIEYNDKKARRENRARIRLRSKIMH
jgi:hypothetical protein